MIEPLILVVVGLGRYQVPVQPRLAPVGALIGLIGIYSQAVTNFLRFSLSPIPMSQYSEQHRMENLISLAERTVLF